ncbi:MAG: DUF1549 domain-containing protein, partial [Pirellulales bacterium]
MKRVFFVLFCFLVAAFLWVPFGEANETVSSSGGIGKSSRADDFGIPHVAFINEQIEEGWSDAGIRPSRSATDGEWCRRVFLDVIGRIPSLEELEAFSK